MTWPLVELTFWNPGDGHNPAIDPLLADPATPLAKHGLTGIATAYARETGARLHPDHEGWAGDLNRRAMAVDGAMAQVVPALADRGIDFFIAKGPTLAYDGRYASPDLRPYTDLDVYLDEHHRKAAEEVLRDLAFEPVPHKRGVLGGAGGEWSGGAFGAIVELHEHLVDNFYGPQARSLKAMIGRRQTRVICGTQVPVAAPEDELELLCTHLVAGHRFAKLILLRDVRAALDGIRTGSSEMCEISAQVLTALGVPVRHRSRTGLASVVAASFKATPPQYWDEFQVSRSNVAALGYVARAGGVRHLGPAVIRGLKPDRGRRANVKPPRRRTRTSGHDVVFASEALAERPCEGAQVLAHELAAHMGAAHGAMTLGPSSSSSAGTHVYMSRSIGVRAIAALLSSRPRCVVYLPANGLTRIALLRAVALWLASRGAALDIVVVQRHTSAHGRAARLLPRSWTFVSAMPDAGRVPHRRLQPRVDPSRVSSHLGRAEAREQLGLSKDRTVFLHVGHAKPGRNLAVLDRLVPCGEVVLILSPYQEEDPTELPTDPNVRIVRGYCSEIGTYYRAASVYVFPTHATGSVIETPMSVFESLANRVPVVARSSPFMDCWGHVPGITLVNNDDELVDSCTDLSNTNSEVHRDVSNRRDQCAADLTPCLEVAANA